MKHTQEQIRHTVRGAVDKAVHITMQCLQDKYEVSGDISPAIDSDLELAKIALIRAITAQLNFGVAQEDNDVMVRIIDGAQLGEEITLTSFLEANPEIIGEESTRLCYMLIGERIRVNGFVGHSVLVQRTR